MKTLAEIRTEIDALDSEIVPLLERRLRVSESVAEAKRAESLAIDDPVRERAILDSVAARVSPDCADSIRAVYRAIFSASKERQRRHQSI